MFRRLLATALERAARELLRAAARVHPMPLPRDDGDAAAPVPTPPVELSDLAREMLQQAAAPQPSQRPERRQPLRGSAAWRRLREGR